MNPQSHRHEICLTHNTPVRIPSPRGVRVTCTAGVLWLTVEGESGDIFLTAGDSHLIGARGLALVEAIGYGRARLEQVGDCPALSRQRPMSALLQRLLGAWRVSRDAVRAPLAVLRRPAVG